MLTYLITLLIVLAGVPSAKTTANYGESILSVLPADSVLVSESMLSNLIDARIGPLENEIRSGLETNFRLIQQLQDEKEYLSSQLEESVEERDQLLTSVSETQVGFETSLRQAENQIRELNLALSIYADSLDSLNSIISEKSATLASEILENRTALEQNRQQTDEQIGSIGQEFMDTISRNRIYWIMAFAFLGALSLIGFVLFRKKLGSQQEHLEQGIQDARSSLLDDVQNRSAGLQKELTSLQEHVNTEMIKIDQKLVDLLGKQLDADSVNDKNSGSESKTQNTAAEEIDHSLALKVADEITRIEKNLSHMDKGTKGLKQLSQSVSRIQKNFAARGYEIEDLIGKQYDEGMRVDVNIIPDENAPKDTAIISRIIKPQVLYKGKMIQTGHVEVLQGIN